MSGIGIIETPAVGAELLDRNLGRHGPERDRLGGYEDAVAVLHRVKERDCGRAVECLGDTLRDQYECDRKAERQQDHDAPYEEHPEVADGSGRPSGEREDECHQHGHTFCRRQEVLDGEPGHLGEVTDSDFRYIGLPVGVGGKTYRSIEREIPGHGPKAGGIEWEVLLDELEEECHKDTGYRKDHEGDGKLLPVHIGRSVYTPECQEFLFDKCGNRCHEIGLAGEY